MLELIQRYKAVIHVVKKERRGNMIILDVGGGSESISPFLNKGYNITSTDVEFRGKKKVNTVKASAEKLPFKKNSFDIVISIDMLEHIPKKLREKAVYEMIRVAKNRVILACPCGNLAEKYEKKLINFARKINKKLPWLEEHQKNGLPKEKEIIKYIGKNNFKIIKNCNLNYWYFSHFIDFITNPLQKLIGKKIMFSIYGPVSKLFNFGKCYRKIFSIKLK